MKKSFDELIKEYESLLQSNLLKEDDGNKLTYFFNSVIQGLLGGKSTSFQTPTFDPSKNFYVLIDPKKNFDVFYRRVNNKGIDKCEIEIDDFIENHEDLKKYLNSTKNESQDIQNIRSEFSALDDKISGMLRGFMSVNNPKVYQQEEFIKAIEDIAEENIELKKNILSIKLYNGFYNSLLIGQNWLKLSEIAKDVIYRTTKDNKMMMGKRKFSPFIKEDSKYLNENTHNLILEIVKPTKVVFYMSPEQYEISKKGGFIKQGVNFIANDIGKNIVNTFYEN